MADQGYRSYSKSCKLCTMTPIFVGLISEEFLESPEELCAVEDINLGCQLVGENFSDVSNDDLDEYVREILEVTPSAGQRLVEGDLRKRGFRTQRHRIQDSIRRVDPVLRTLRAAQQIIRRVNSVPCPNALW